MRPSELRTTIQALANIIAAQSESGADTILRAADLDATPNGWGRQPDSSKLASITKILINLPDDDLETLIKLLLNNGLSRIESIGDALVRLSESEVDMALRSAGSSEFTPQGWGQKTDLMKSLQVRAILISVPDSVLDNLMDFLSENEAPIASGPAPTPVIEDTPIAGRPAPTPVIEVEAMSDKPIFVVHGHAHAILHEAVRVLERATGRDVIVLHEQANAGRTILEKFEAHAADALFAVVLLTGDDEGGTRTGDAKNLRGRQNVIFELGFFFGKLGRDRVAVLLQENVEKPSDIDGLVYINLDRAGAWKQALARELEALDIQVNYSRIP